MVQWIEDNAIILIIIAFVIAVLEVNLFSYSDSFSFYILNFVPLN